MSSLNNWTDITFPSDCDSGYNLGEIPTDQNCVLNPQLSQVSDLYIQPDGADAPFLWTGSSASINSDGVGNNVTNNSKSKWLVGQGGIPAPEETIYQGPKLMRVVGKRTYQLNFQTEVYSNDQRNFIRQLQSGWSEFKFWIGTLGGNLFGGPNGISPFFVNARLPLDPGDEDYEKGFIVIEFQTSNGGMPRTANPLRNFTPLEQLVTVAVDDDGNTIGWFE
jgi:hypothetical protein